MSGKQDSIYKAFQAFGSSVKDKTTQLTSGAPEDQLRGPFETLISEIASSMDLQVVCTGETPLPNRFGRPDYAVHCNGLLAGYAELKAPGTGARASHFKGRNKQQFKRFSDIPNILYTDGNEWALYRNGELERKIVQLSGDIISDGQYAISREDVKSLEPLLYDFFQWEPIIPKDRKGKVDLERFAEMLAPLTRMLRDNVVDALKDPRSPLVLLAKDWRQLLFPDATDDRFADAYAQTVTFALLLGRSEGADPLNLSHAENALAAQHSLLSRALEVLTDPRAQTEISASLDLLIRIIGAVPPATFTGPEDPWLYFYEDFLAVYDPQLRKNAGVYYTPIEVVHAQVHRAGSVPFSSLPQETIKSHQMRRYSYEKPALRTTREVQICARNAGSLKEIPANADAAFGGIKFTMPSEVDIREGAIFRLPDYSSVIDPGTILIVFDQKFKDDRVELFLRTIQLTHLIERAPERYGSSLKKYERTTTKLRFYFDKDFLESGPVDEIFSAIDEWVRPFEDLDSAVRFAESIEEQ